MCLYLCVCRCECVCVCVPVQQDRKFCMRLTGESNAKPKPTAHDTKLSRRSGRWRSGPTAVRAQTQCQLFTLHECMCVDCLWQGRRRNRAHTQHNQCAIHHGAKSSRKGFFPFSTASEDALRILKSISPCSGRAFLFLPLL